jgi:hypothetical protein
MITRQDFFMSQSNVLKSFSIFFIGFFICPQFGWTIYQENLNDSPKVIVSDSVAYSYHVHLNHKSFDTLKKSKVKTFYNPAFKHNYANNLHVNVEKIDQKLVKAWIESKVEELAAMNLNDASLKEIKPNYTIFNEFYQLEYRLKGSGIIKFSSSDWVYLISHSYHENQNIGDITLAMTSDKQFYLNAGHICGGIVSFITNDKNSKITSESFFQNFTCDTDYAKWTRYEKNK